MEEYFSAKRDWLSKCLLTNYIVGTKDVSDIIRGKILCLDDILATKNVFKKFDELQQKVKQGAN